MQERCLGPARISEAISRAPHCAPAKPPSITERAFDLLEQYQQFTRDSSLDVCETVCETEASIANQRCRDLDELEIQLILLLAYTAYFDHAAPSDETRVCRRLAGASLEGLSALRSRLGSPGHLDPLLEDLRLFCLNRDERRTDA